MRHAVPLRGTRVNHSLRATEASPTPPPPLGEKGVPSMGTLCRNREPGPQQVYDRVKRGWARAWGAPGHKRTKHTVWAFFESRFKHGSCKNTFLREGDLNKDHVLDSRKNYS